ncbi:MmgE/PrpD family protein [Paraburkholderia elongata]|uniref:MmgE/PrpD family protein n=1 Tax=Paraburkholderia elongata TaxID=2675747 RepID=UPI0015545F70|nr:MmgE/PrpD family protein [Paraburkholderia elongata]
MTSRPPSASETIASFASAFDPASLDDSHIRTCGRAIADTFAVCIAASDEPAVHRMRGYVAGLTPGLEHPTSASRPGFARIWGRREATTVEGAALLNGTAAHVLDFDDASSPMSGHPSVALLPALMALGEARDISAGRLASGYVVGLEIACKLGKALATTHYDRGWHMTSSVGTIAAAAACAHLLGLDVAATVSAIGLAVAQTAGTRANFGFDAKSFQAGQCGAAALRAVLLAERGFSASPGAIDGRAGYTSLYSNSEDISAQLHKLGELPLEIERSGVEIKKYPACYAVHRALDGLFELKKEFDLKLDDIESVEIETSYGALSPLIRGVPASGVEAKFSMGYAVAAAIEDGVIGLSSFTDAAVHRPRLQSFIERVSASEVAGGMTPRWASVAVRTKDGRLLSRHIDSLRGAPSNPLSDQELIEKITDCLAWADSPIDAVSLYEAATNLRGFSVREVLDAIEGATNPAYEVH